MKSNREVQLAERIIQLDLLRDELYEELLKTYGWRAQEFLRAVQNSQFINLPDRMQNTQSRNEAKSNSGAFSL